MKFIGREGLAARLRRAGTVAAGAMLVAGIVAAQPEPAEAKSRFVFANESDYDTVDLYVGYDLTDHVTLSADVRNLFDEDPPFVDITGGYDPQASNPVPRLISVGAAVKF